jgi:endoglucanase
VTGLASRDYRQDTAATDAQIEAAKWWCANTVRLQVAQANLVGSSGSSLSRPFLRAVEAAVSLAGRYRLVVVLSDQTQVVGMQPGPTAATAAFWKDLTRVYGHSPQLVFDLFNEPHVKTGDPARDWRIWQRGGTYRGTSYLGMQRLVTDVRHDGAANLLWVEGPYWAGTLNEVASHPVTGGPLVYDIHHPKGSHDAASWTADFGYLVRQHIAPVVDGEWTNYAAHRHECWTNAPTAVPVYLRYLARLGVGMTAWALRKHVLIESDNLWDPTRIKSSWGCTRALDQGAGRQVMNWYKQHNKG